METQKNSPKSKVTRWWPAVVVIAGFALALAVIWSTGGDNQQYRVLRTLAAISISSLLLAAWARFFSRLAKRTRMALPSTGCAAGLAKAMNNSATTAKPQQNKRAGANPGPSSGWWGILLTNQLFAQRRP